MVTLNALKNKKGRYFQDLYREATAQALSDCYKEASSKKQEAYNYCHTLFEREGGQRFRIISHSAYTFSAAWTTEEGLRVETVGNSYIVLS